MTPAFTRRGAGIRMDLRRGEADLLRQLRDELAQFLTAPPAGDPVTTRLFPATVREDDEADQELRGLIHDDLLRERLQRLDELLAILDRAPAHRSRVRVDLVDEEPLVVLGVLNDLRLALGARIGVADLVREDITSDHPHLHTLVVMDHLAGWQEQLLAALDPESVRHYDEGHDPPED